jgi:hypothetical protein
MKRLLVAASASLLAAAVAGLVAAPARAIPSCGAIDAVPETVGFTHGSIPGLNSSISANVGNFGSSVAQDHVNGWVGIDDGTQATPGTGGTWIQAGVIDDIGDAPGIVPHFPTTSGFVQYIAYQIPPAGPVFHAYGPANVDSRYTAKITHSGSGLWTAQIGGNVLSNIGISFSGTNARSDFLGQSADNGTGQCNPMDFDFFALAPWSTGLLTPYSNTGNYFVCATPPTEFHAYEKGHPC